MIHYLPWVFSQHPGLVHLHFDAAFYQLLTEDRDLLKTNLICYQLFVLFWFYRIKRSSLVLAICGCQSAKTKRITTTGHQFPLEHTTGPVSVCKLPESYLVDLKNK